MSWLRVSSERRISIISPLITPVRIFHSWSLHPYTHIHPFPGTLVDTLNWSSVELGVAIFIACFPSFKALVTFRFPELRRALGLSSDRSYAGRYEMYGTSGRRTDRRSWGGPRSHLTPGHSKLENVTTRTQTEVEASRNDSEERIISSESPAGIQVTTDVSVNRLSSGPAETGQEHGHWPLGP